MGQVGGNGSVVWQNKNRKGGAGIFKDLNGNGKISYDQVRKDNGLEVWGRDEVAIAEVGTAPVEGLENETPDLKGFQKEGHFLVRLRFDDPEDKLIQAWYERASSDVRDLVKVVKGVSQDHRPFVIMAVNVKAIGRPNWPANGKTFENMPWEIRYDW